MQFRLALAQIRHPEDGDARALVEDYARRAADSNADMLVFPESLMTRFELDKQSFMHEAQALDGPFPTAIDEIAKSNGIWIVYTMNEANAMGGCPYNTAVITDSHGLKRGVYRKVHLFDSDTVRESERMSRSDQIFEPIQTPFGKIGLGICYDLRFPEFARKQALEGCELLIYPAAWVSGPGKIEQWKTLLGARAIENEMFVAGICRSDAGYVGESYVFGPDGLLRAQTREANEELAFATIDMDDIRAMRSRIPALEHRREELY